jgi:hypothetical protein
MGVYDNLPTLDLSLLRPQRLIKFRTQDDGIEGGRNGPGSGQVISFSGGGILTGGYGDCFVQSDEQHEYVDALEARLSGSFRYINVPIMTDISGPFPTRNGAPLTTYPKIFDPDESIVDGAIPEADTVTGEISADAALHAGVIEFTLSGAARDLRHGLWFSIQHDNKGHRAYQVWEIQEGAPNYTCAISPPLDEPVTDGTAMRITRPLCVMRYPVGFSAATDVTGFWRSRPTFMFEEAP